jgi:hypothetical protein
VRITGSPELATKVLAAHSAAVHLLAREMRDASNPADRRRYLELLRRRLVTCLKIAVGASLAT